MHPVVGVQAVTEAVHLLLVDLFLKLYSNCTALTVILKNCIAAKTAIEVFLSV